MKKVAIITGAASGIGRATAQILAREGARVIVTDIRHGKAKRTASEIGDRAVFHPLDVSDPLAWDAVIAFAKNEFGRIDILVNNAAVPSFSGLDDGDLNTWLDVFKVNAAGPFLGCKAVVPEMTERGGSIVNVSSNSAVSGMQSVPIYSSSKGAVNALTRALAAHMRHNQIPIRVNTVMPGGTRSDMATDAIEAHFGEDSEQSKAILANLSPPEHLGAAIAFLCSDAAAGINGTELLVDDAETFTFPV